MSYCHGCSSIGINFSNGFGLQPGNVMRNFINNALCFSNCNNECLSTIYVGAPVLSGNSANYNAFNTLYSGTTLYNGSNVTFTATNLVLLNPGFVAQYGSTLVANNTPCTPLLSSENLKRHLVTSEPDLKNVEVFPNPFTHNFEVLFYSNTNELATINVYTMLGNKVNLALTRHLSKGLNKFSVDAESLLPGIYMLEIRASEKSKMIRIIKN
ncbi:MAG: T9SS type A sorting domain-containing protein [Bacteroidetes bacterium]|nr:T9SS type A sorting domain-containing protein [Bacteroidota bacterium]